MTRAFKCKECGHIVERDNFPPSMIFDYLRLEDARLCERCYGKPKMNTETHVVGVPIPRMPTPTCPECGTTEYYRVIYTDDEMTEVKFYDCMMCHTHWDKDGNNLGKH